METTRAGIAIYKINYQSDFILTVVCDVEWGTPFCIKFWTGEPSQAYYVGWTGTEYKNCKVVESDPSKLLVLFDDHHLPVGELKMQIVYHTTIEDFPNAIVDEVTNSMKVMAFIDGKNQKIALDFEGEEAAELQFELPAYANEAQRIANEEQRIANEQARIEAEQQRIDNEQTRQDNEAQRIAQETDRVNEYAELKADAVAATDAANDAATLANQKAQLAADKAALADAAATLANQKAQLAADKAALADAAATLANQKAEYADAQGDYAKEQGDYAKDQGDTALADHRRAESDHETAASDHTIAENDHTQAGNDHTRAESDHSTAADDHTLAASDHSTAANDHTQAGNDHTRAESDHTRAESDHAAVEVYVDSLGSFDISSYHATGGVLAKYADLTAALGTNGANIPEAIRKGGMSVKFVHSSDNKYVKFFCTAQNFTTDVTQWQGMDNIEEAIGEQSKNIYNNFDAIADFCNNRLDLSMPFETGALTSANKISTEGAYANYKTTGYIQLRPEKQYVIAIENISDSTNTSYRRIYLLYDALLNPIPNSFVNDTDVHVVTGTSYIRMSFINSLVESTTIKPVIQEGNTLSAYTEYGRAHNRMVIDPGYGAAMQADFSELERKYNRDVPELQQNVDAIADCNNLLDLSDVVTGYLRVDNTITTGGSYDNYRTTGYIPLNPNAQYIVSVMNVITLVNDGTYTRTFWLYDENKNPIANSYSEDKNSHVITGASFIRACFAKSDIESANPVPVIQKGNTLQSYVKFGHSCNKSDIPELLSLSDQINKAFYANLINPKDSFTEGVITSSGTISTAGSHAIYKTTGYIGLDKKKSYVLALVNTTSSAIVNDRVLYAIFDEEKNIIGYDNQINTSFLITNASYIRCSFKASYIDNETGERPLLKEGSSVSPYEPYGYKWLPSIGGSGTDILHGKKWWACGDSFTEWTTEQYDPVEYPNITGLSHYKSYPFWIGSRTGMIVYNFAVSGQTMAMPAEPGSFTNAFSNDLYKEIPSDVDYITLKFGINDFHHRPGGSGGDGEDNTGEIPIGDVSDTGTATFCGAYNTVLEYLIEHHPFAKIGILVSNGCGVDTYRQKTIAIAEKWGIPYLDENGDHNCPAMIRSTNPNVCAAVKQLRLDSMAADLAHNNTHPNVNAHKFESTFVEAFLRSL